MLSIPRETRAALPSVPFTSRDDCAKLIESRTFSMLKSISQRTESNNQCFVTRREAYDECGGLKPELGHFSEWVLAASYLNAVGRSDLPEARIHHHYIGSLPELKPFT